jgi:peptidoglycan/xylan/chitin deacetylase (PgdA/CDA1 family)
VTDDPGLLSWDRSPTPMDARGRWAVNVNVHGIGPRPARSLDLGEDQVWISVEQFEGLLDAAVGRRDVTLTFDDGNASDLEIALPRLQERGLTARFYPCAGLLGEPGRIDASGVRELHRAGMVIGSHGWTHRDWRSLDWGPSGATEVEEEMVRARRHLEHLTGSDVSEIAVPFGSYDRHVIRTLRQTGVTRMYTSDGGWARTGAWLQPRNSIRTDHGPDWPLCVMAQRPSLRRQARARVAGVAKRLRG